MSRPWSAIRAPIPNETRDARQQLLTQSRRATLFEAQQQVLEGKHRTLTRYRDRLTQLDADLATVRAGTSVMGAAAAPGSLARALVVRAAAPRSDATDPSVLLRAQEELRREIARQMHDGPAQSLANIALQAEIVLRLASRGDGRTHGELGQLRAMVEHALDATKEFIFDVRPMVLDDLGLVPTLRRTAVDRGRRAGVEIDLDSQGTERRLAQDVESGLFRLIDDTINGYLALRPVPGRGAHGVGAAAAHRGRPGGLAARPADGARPTTTRRGAPGRPAARTARDDRAEPRRRASGGCWSSTRWPRTCWPTLPNGRGSWASGSASAMTARRVELSVAITP